MVKKRRRQYSGTDKVAILKRHLVNGETISDICDELKLNPNMYYRWQKTFFENGAKAFETTGKRAVSSDEQRLVRLKDKLSEKDSVISELVTELIRSKKNDGDL
jgi:transposase-like protein